MSGSDPGAGADGAPVSLSVFGWSHTGRQRSENQDSFLVADLNAPDGETSLFGGMDDRSPTGASRVASGGRGCLLLVADGMGGAAAGAVASRLASTTIHQAMQAPDAGEESPPGVGVPSRLRRALEVANRRVREWSTRHAEYRGMGCTATAAGIVGRALHVAHVGDSRAYLLRDGEPLRLTRDHTVFQELVDSGSMTEDEAEGSGHAHVLLRALGSDETVQVEEVSRELRDGDLVLLCSDGLSGQVDDGELAERASARRDLAGLCQDLVELANRRGGPDNVTVVAARVEERAGG